MREICRRTKDEIVRKNRIKCSTNEVNMKTRILREKSLSFHWKVVVVVVVLWWCELNWTGSELRRKVRFGVSYVKLQVPYYETEKNTVSVAKPITTFLWNLVCLGWRKWPCGIRHELSSPAETLGSCVRLPLETWMSVCVYSVCVVSYVSRGLAKGWGRINHGSMKDARNYYTKGSK
jgi:hypothetical protein